MASAKTRRPTRAKPAKVAKRPVPRPAPRKPSPRPKPKAAKRPARPYTAAEPVEVPDAPLGPLTIPEPEQAQAILAELAALNDKAVYLHTKYEAVREKAKEAKLAWESAVTSVQEKLRLVTHPSLAELPLFDAVEREQDQARMEEAATNEGMAPPAEVPDDALDPVPF